MEHKLVTKQTRSLIMGIAALLICCFHCSVALPANAIGMVLKLLRGCSEVGVDMFIFLSGYGLVKATNKLPSLGWNNYWKKRLKRLMPTYLLAVGCVIIFSGITAGFDRPCFVQAFMGITTLGFWVNHLSFDWFTPTILLFYLLLPFVIRDKSLLGRCVGLGLIFLGLHLVVALTGFGGHLTITLARMPVFLLGIYISKYEELNVRIPSAIKHPAVYVIITLCCLAVCLGSSYILPSELRIQLGLRWYPWAPIVPILLFYLDRLFRFILNPNTPRGFVAPLKPLMLLFGYAGIYSYEVYLIHTQAIRSLTNIDIDVYTIGIYSSIIIGTLFLAKGFRWVAEHLNRTRK